MNKLIHKLWRKYHIGKRKKILNKKLELLKKCDLKNFFIESTKLRNYIKQISLTPIPPLPWIRLKGDKVTVKTVGDNKSFEISKTIMESMNKKDGVHKIVTYN